MRRATLRDQLALVLACLGTVGAAACRTVPRQNGISAMQIDTLWYATARQRDNNRLAYAIADSIEYGFYRVAARANIDAMRASLDLRVIDSGRLSSTEFMAGLARPSSDSNDVVVLSVHGYKTNHSKAVRDAAESYRRSGSKARWVVFSWPSAGRGVNWTQAGGFITGAYREDSVAAVKSRPAFVRLVNALHATVGGRRLTLVTHSMGAQILSEALSGDSSLQVRLTANPIRAIGFFEPDVPAARFADYSVPRLTPLASRIALYASRNDLMLQISRVVNRSDRAGLLGGAPVAVDRIETIDITDGLSSESFIRRSFGAHHAMRRESGALRDFFEIVVRGEPAECRVLRGSALPRGEGSWQLVPFRGTSQACPR
ncbi:MAG: alpha/beta hydrolase [Phycisphaerae bacterium]|nr:alpha/beta hydrolase [Gemmatimonadaceae bacterium]